MPTVYLGLGANLGDRLESLRRAVAELAGHVTVMRVSSLYETEPWGVGDQPPFLNAVVEGSTELSPAGLLVRVKAMEQCLGRRLGPRWGPRVIDIDILYYDRQVIDTPDLQIPHPRVAERAFVLVPLAELVPELVDPRSGRPVRDLLLTVGIGRVQRVAGPEWVRPS